MRRIDDLVRDLISKTLLEEIGDEELGVITVTHVKTTPDLRYADVWVSFLAEDKDAKFEKLLTHAREIQKYLGRDIATKYVPKLTFKLDLGVEDAERVEELIQKIKREKK